MGKRFQTFWTRRVERAQAVADRRREEHIAAKDPNAVSYDEAARLLGRRDVTGLLARGYLDKAVMLSGFQGVSMESIDRELDWQRTSTRWQRAARRARDVLDRLWCIVIFSE